MSGDVHVQFYEGLRGKFPRATLRLAHCKTRVEAERVLESIRRRLGECGLELHPDKTKIVYCKDEDRRGNPRNQSFDFLGYTFRPRLSKSKYGKHFVNFLPAVSSKAATRIRR